MKYSIGDRVIVKESGEWGIVVGADEMYTRQYQVHKIGSVSACWYSGDNLLTDLTAIEKPFGLLSKEVQDELKAVDNGENIEYQWNGEWRKRHENIYDQNYTYRLSLTYKQEEVKEMTVGEIEAKLGHRVKVVKGE